uniref:Uncharacterized protein n=1 Tax=viral metagenome TaxID=1070528 RepID=A0A6C0B902_9ZZZZ
MRLFTNLLRKFFIEPKKILGRWHLDDCNKRINKKIDYSNEDHCGPCGQYKLPDNVVEIPKNKPK